MLVKHSWHSLICLVTVQALFLLHHSSFNPSAAACRQAGELVCKALALPLPLACCWAMVTSLCLSLCFISEAGPAMSVLGGAGGSAAELPLEDLTAAGVSLLLVRQV